MRRKAIYPHKSLRRMPFRLKSLMEGLAVAAVSDLFVLWQMPRVFEWQSKTVGAFLDWANVPWTMGRQAEILPGITVSLVNTSYLDYAQNPMYPWNWLVGAIAVFIIGYQFWPAPIRPLLLMLPASFAITVLYMLLISPTVPYTPEDFCSIWYHGEAYIWLLVPWIFAIGYFTLSVPFRMKLTWPPLLIVYAFFWSAVRLALALATFYYFGPIWMPFFYFVLGFLADFLYIVMFYSLAMDQAAVWLARKKEVWQ